MSSGMKVCIILLTALAVACSRDNVVPTAPTGDSPRLVLAANFTVDDDGVECPSPDFATIQAAITAASAGDVIQVCAGTYVENVILNKSLTLNGAQAGVDARGRAAAESNITPGAGTRGIELRTGSAGSTIDGFTITGGAKSIESTTGPLNGLSILNNRLMGFTGGALFMNDPGTDVTIDQNAIDAASQTAGGGTMHFDTDAFPGLHVTNNTVMGYGVGTGLFVDGNHNVGESATRTPTISGNVFDGSVTGINLGSRAFGTFGAPTLGLYGGMIVDNTFSNGVVGAQGGFQHVLIKGNTFSDNTRAGLELTSFGNAGADRGAQNSVITENEFHGNGFAPPPVPPRLGEALFFTSTQAAGTISTNVAHLNNISGNNNGATYAGSETIDVECNWWGHASGPSGDGGGTGDTVLTPGTGTLDFEPWLTAPAPGGPCDGPLPTANDLKTKARDDLSAIYPTDDKKTDDKLGKALEKLQESLDAPNWVDGNHIDGKKADKIFTLQKEAVKKLQEIKDPPEGVQDVVDQAILDIVAGDRLLAQTAIDDLGPGADPKKQQKAMDELAKGDDEAAKGKYDNAIEHYKKAWKEAQKAE